ncbi:MAG: sigma-70 family RNA polymerase sigma factor [Planctomycetes bacterium]|nr:sigma-70 family RNA polymerase sigma factor [Planctomycetota bacterium]
MPDFEKLVHEYHAMVYRIAFGILRDSAGAEDAAQDVFLDFLRRPGPLERALNAKAFVGRAAVNRALKARRGAERRARREEAVETGRAAMDPAERAFRNEVRERVAGLPEGERLAVELHYGQGFTIAETAEALEVPAGTASRRISEAVAKLRKWLAAGAFAALAAGLERELEAAEGVPVPAGLEERLAGLARGASAGSARGRRVAAIAGGIAVVLVLAVGIARWKAGRDSGGGFEVSGARAVAASMKSEDRAPGGGAGPEERPASVPNAPAEADAWVEREIEGFLYRAEGRLVVGPEVVPSPGAPVPGKPLWVLEAAGDRVWPVEPERLGAIPAAETREFTAFLTGYAGAAEAPRARVRLRVRAPRVPDPEASPADRGADSGPRIESPEDAKEELQALKEELNRLNEERARRLALAAARAARPAPPLPSAVVLEVLEVEILSDVWLEAWREMYDVAGLVIGASPERLGPLAARLARALERARLARAGQSPTSWRVRMEHAFAAASAPTLAAAGFGNLLPPIADEEKLLALLFEADSPEDLRASVAGLYGEEGLDLRVPVVAPEDGGPRISLAQSESDGESETTFAIGEPTWASMALREIASMEPGKFLELRNATRDRRAEDLRESAAALQSESVAGLTLDPLPDNERGGLEGGARVAAVDPGSPAARAGLLPGDIVWRAAGRPVASPAALARLLDREPRPVALDVLRGSEQISVTLEGE